MSTFLFWAFAAVLLILLELLIISICNGRHFRRVANDWRRQAEECRDTSSKRIAELEGLINTAETSDWLKGVPLESAHQIERWGQQHDLRKTPWDWFWLIGCLAQKAAAAHLAGDIDKAQHHTITTGAALLRWHRLIGTDAKDGAI